MAGTFDEDIRAAMQGMSSRQADPAQAARDMVARQRNMAERGVNSTAYPGPRDMSNVFPAAPGAGGAELPSSAPTPTPSPADQLVERYAGNDAMSVGGAGVVPANTPSLPRMIQNPGSDASTGGTVPDQNARPSTVPGDDGGMGGAGVAALVGIAAATGLGVGELINRYLAGDPEITKAVTEGGAAEAVEKIGGAQGTAVAPVQQAPAQQGRAVVPYDPGVTAWDQPLGAEQIANGVQEPVAERFAPQVAAPQKKLPGPAETPEQSAEKRQGKVTNNKQKPSSRGRRGPSPRGGRVKVKP